MGSQLAFCPQSRADLVFVSKCPHQERPRRIAVAAHRKHLLLRLFAMALHSEDVSARNGRGR